MTTFVADRLRDRHHTPRQRLRGRARRRLRRPDRPLPKLPDPAAQRAVYVHRPPRPGLGGRADAPTFAELWPTLRAWIDDAAFVAAHNAPFDRSVLHACCARYRLRPPRASFTCTVQLARAQWGIRPTKLPDVCRRLRIPLRHHDAGSDAVACARIVLTAEAAGWLPGKGRAQRIATRAMVRLALVGGRAQWPDWPRCPAFVRPLHTWWKRLRRSMGAYLR